MVSTLRTVYIVREEKNEKKGPKLTFWNSPPRQNPRKHGQGHILGHKSACYAFHGEGSLWRQSDFHVMHKVYCTLVFQCTVNSMFMMDMRTDVIVCIHPAEHRCVNILHVPTVHIVFILSRSFLRLVTYKQILSNVSCIFHIDALSSNKPNIKIA